MAPEKQTSQCEPLSGASEKPYTVVLHDIALGFLVAFLVARTMISGLNQGPRMPSINKLIELLPALALFVWILSAIACRRVKFEKTAIRIPLLVLIVVSVLSVAEASYIFSAAHNAATWIIHICVFFLVVNLSVQKRRYRVLLAATIATFAVVSVLSIYQYTYEFEAVRQFYAENKAAVVIQEDLQQDFMNRLLLDEAFGTFLLSNMLAGYLILVLPVAGFLLYGAIKQKNMNSLGFLLIVITVGASAIALYFSGSKGGWLGLLAGCLLFLMFYRYQRKPEIEKRKTRFNYLLIAGVLLVVCVAGILIVGYDGLPESVKVRLGYWDATLRIIVHHPFGTGLSNFEEHYSQHQQLWATEVRSAHNSYLSIWAELSIIGLCAFLAVIYISGRRFISALKSGESPCLEDEDANEHKPFYLLMTLAGILGFILIAFMGTFAEIPFTQPVRIILFSIFLWGIVFLGLLFSGKLLNKYLASLGIAAGLMALLCHMFIDFDFYSHGINASFWVMLGLLLGACCRFEKKEPDTSRVSGLAITAGLLIMAVIFIFGVVYIPRAITADITARNGRMLAEDAVKSGYDEVITRKSIEHFEEAQELSPWNSENYRSAAELYDNLFKNTKNPSYAGMSLDNFAKLLKIRPNSHSAYFQLGFLKLSISGKDVQKMAIGLLDVQKAVELYPNKAGYHFWLALYLEQMASASDAAEAATYIKLANTQYRKAVEIHNNVAYRRGRLSTDQLNAIKRRLEDR